MSSMASKDNVFFLLDVLAVEVVVTVEEDDDDDADLVGKALVSRR